MKNKDKENENRPVRPDCREILSDCMMVGGGVLLIIGAGISSFAAGLIVTGVVSILYGIFIAVGGDKE